MKTETRKRPWAAKGETTCHLRGLVTPTVAESTPGPSGWCPSKSEQVSWEAVFPGKLPGTTSWNASCSMPPPESKNGLLMTQNSTGSHKSTQILPTWFFIHKTGCLFPNQPLLPP